jgi:hypothetical protein
LVVALVNVAFAVWACAGSATSRTNAARVLTTDLVRVNAASSEEPNVEVSRKVMVEQPYPNAEFAEISEEFFAILLGS